MFYRFPAALLLCVAGLTAAGAMTAEWTTTPEQIAQSEQLMRWQKQCLELCAVDTRCKKTVCVNTLNHLTQCARGDRLGCDDRDRDLLEILQLNTHPMAAATRTANRQPQAAIVACLQETAMDVVEACKKTDCIKGLMPDVIGEAQKARCGYSGIQSVEASPSSLLNPNLTRCFTTPNFRGEPITTCRQY